VAEKIPEASRLEEATPVSRRQLDFAAGAPVALREFDAAGTR